MRLRLTLLYGALFLASGVALGVMSIVALALGWFVAGRALRPLRTMAGNVREISARDLHRRLRAAGPADEITELADTFDALLEHAFEAQRRFVANASHELRTPLTFERSALEVVLAAPRPSVGELRATAERVLESNRRQGEMLEALLVLARSQRGLERRSLLELAEIAQGAVALAGGVTFEAQLDPARVWGDRPPMRAARRESRGERRAPRPARGTCLDGDRYLRRVRRTPGRQYGRADRPGGGRRPHRALPLWGRHAPSRG
jgi:signal transduction histidine kinase